jgi:hypothetical protein
MEPRLLCSTLSFEKLTPALKDMEKMFQNWDRQNLILDSSTHSSDFAHQNLALTLKFINSLLLGSNYFWAIYSWICGASSSTDIAAVFNNGFINGLLMYDARTLQGWPKTVRSYVLQSVHEYFNDDAIDSLDQFGEYLIYKQMYPQHNPSNCIYPDVELRISKEKIYFLCEDDDLITFFSTFPNHSLKCVQNLYKLVVIPPFTLPKTSHTWITISLHFRCLKKTKPYSLLCADVIHHINTSEYATIFSDHNILYDDEPPHLRQYWNDYNNVPRSTPINIATNMSQCTTPSFSPLQLTNYVADTIPSFKLQYINYDNNKYDRIIDWMKYRDSTFLTKSLSVRLKHKKTRLSPFFVFKDHCSQQRGGVLVFENCGVRALCTLSMCEQTRNIEKPLCAQFDQGQTLLITSQHLVHHWDKKIFEFVKPINGVRLSCKFSNNTRLSELLTSRYVIIPFSVFRNIQHSNVISQVEWFRIVIDNACSLTPNSITSTRIQQLRSQRKWCLSLKMESQMINLLELINMWNIVQKPKTEQSTEIYAASRELFLTVSSSSARQRQHVHFCTLPPNTRNKLDSFSRRIFQTSRHTSKFVIPMLNVLASGQDIHEARLWEVFIGENLLPAYEGLPIATETGITYQHCVVCHEEPFARPVQFQCRHVICYECANMVQKCPMCRAARTQCYRPKELTTNQVSTIICNEKYQQLTVFLANISRDPNTKIIVVSPSATTLDLGTHAMYITNDDPCNVDNYIEAFARSQQQILVVPKKLLHYIHCETVTHFVVPFVDKDFSVCTCAKAEVHFFIFQYSIEHFMYQNGGSWKKKKFWAEYMEFLDNNKIFL